MKYKDKSLFLFFVYIIKVCIHIEMFELNFYLLACCFLNLADK